MTRYVTFVALLLLVTVVAFGISSESSYVQLSSDTTVSSTSAQVILQTTLSLSSGKYVLFHSDGRFFPYGTNSLAIVEIRIDGNRVSNQSTLDFRTSTYPEQHTFNCIGHNWVSSGTHTVQLVAYNGSTGAFKVGSSTNLAVVVDPSSVNTVVARSSASSTINHTTYGFEEGDDVTRTNVLNGTLYSTQAPIILLASGRSYVSGSNYGDAMWMPLLGSSCGSANEFLFTVNDIATTAETHAPMFTHAYYNTSGTKTVKLDASELPYEGMPENPVQYQVGSTTELIALSGGMTIHGGVSGNNNSSNCYPGTYMDISADSDGTKSYDKWSDTFTVGSGDNGNVLFLLKTRVLDGCSTNYGASTVRLQLYLDNQAVGSSTVQQFDGTTYCHQRTMTTSYLAEGLSQGNHTIKGRISTSGPANVEMHASGDLGLVYFGN